MNLDKLEVGKEATVDAIHCDDKAIPPAFSISFTTN